MNTLKRKMEDVPPVSKRAVVHSTVTITSIVGVITQMTRPGSPGKVYANVGSKSNDDPRLARLPTVIKFPGPSETTAAIEEPGYHMTPCFPLLHLCSCYAVLTCNLFTQARLKYVTSISRRRPTPISRTMLSRSQASTTWRQRTTQPLKGSVTI